MRDKGRPEHFRRGVSTDLGSCRSSCPSARRLHRLADPGAEHVGSLLGIHGGGWEGGGGQPPQGHPAHLLFGNWWKGLVKCFTAVLLCAGLLHVTVWRHLQYDAMMGVKYEEAAAYDHGHARAHSATLLSSPSLGVCTDTAQPYRYQPRPPPLVAALAKPALGPRLAADVAARMIEKSS